jgi:predicted pyridoxine 5'-phosphate oxidase superfamily flavin-nucleotide-binding protein
MPNAYDRIGFSSPVREERERFGSAEAYARVLSADRHDGAELTAREAGFLTESDAIFQATVSETGWPYVQFRGGPPGFLKIIDQWTIGYADFQGNRQYISVGNLLHDDRVSIIAVDYRCRKRLKLWGHAQIVEDRDVISLLHDGPGARVERGIVIRVSAFG